MRKQLAVTAALASALLITGCANTGGMSDTTRRTATGAGVAAGAAVPEPGPARPRLSGPEGET